MGISLFHLSDSPKSCCNPRSYATIPDQSPPNPNPYKFKIVKTKQIGRYCVVKANYSGTNQYGGNKVMVYELETTDIMAIKKLDPHFLEDEENTSPIARFRGNKEGWNLAIKFAEGLNNV